MVSSDPPLVPQVHGPVDIVTYTSIKPPVLVCSCQNENLVNLRLCFSMIEKYFVLYYGNNNILIIHIPYKI